jgi:BirA family biotin operon repressor/biotin-[acetyl-CoA-carboxylase] ligase
MSMQFDIEWFQEIDSTNDYVRRMVEHKKMFPPMTVAARKQTAGRGRGENRWWSPDGCLMFTSLLDSGNYVRDVSQLPQAALVVGVALADLLSQYIDTANVQLKWPNDVYVRGRKIAGILVEGIQGSPEDLPAFQFKSASMGSGMWWIVGVGLNLAIDWREAPEEVQQRATCVATESGITFPGEEFLPGVVARIDQFLKRWQTEPSALFELFRERCFLREKFVEVNQGTVQYRGICQSVDDQGRLLLATETGIRPISSGSISILSGE